MFAVLISSLECCMGDNTAWGIEQTLCANGSAPADSLCPACEYQM